MRNHIGVDVSKALKEKENSDLKSNLLQIL